MRALVVFLAFMKEVLIAIIMLVSERIKNRKENLNLLWKER